MRSLRDDDAKCQICNSGDYEEEDQIVFCDFCGVSVHQQCYGIDIIPDGEWFCISCSIMGRTRSRNLKCAVCPRWGGALRPTNISAKDAVFLKHETTYIVSGEDEQVQKKSKRGI